MHDTVGLGFVRAFIHAVIVKIVAILDCSADELLGPRKRKATTGSRDRWILWILQQLELLSRRDQEALLRVIDVFLSVRLR
jgi:hypothetical protein